MGLQAYTSPPAADSNGRRDQTWSWPQRTRRGQDIFAALGLAVSARCLVLPESAVGMRRAIGGCSHWTDADKVRRQKRPCSTRQGLAPGSHSLQVVFLGPSPGQGPRPAAGRASGPAPRLPVLDLLTPALRPQPEQIEDKRPLSHGVSWPESGLS